MIALIGSGSAGVPVVMQKPPLLGIEGGGGANVDWENGLKTAYASLSQLLNLDELSGATGDAAALFWYARVRLKSDATIAGDPLGNPGNRMSGRVTRVVHIASTAIFLAVVRTKIGWFVAQTDELEAVE